MNAINMEALGISSDDIMDRAAQKIADEVMDHERVRDLADNYIRAQVDEIIGKRLESQIEATLSEVMGSILNEEVTPRNIWGEKQGKPTTIRAALSERAKDFWQVKVNKEGKPSDSYGSMPRHQWLMERTVKGEFESAIKANIDEVVDGFKAAMREDAGKWIATHIASVFPKQR